MPESGPSQTAQERRSGRPPNQSYPGKPTNLRWHHRPLLEPGDAQKHTDQGRKAAPVGGPIGTKSGGSITPKSGGPIPTKSGGSIHTKSCTLERLEVDNGYRYVIAVPLTFRSNTCFSGCDYVRTLPAAVGLLSSECL